MGEKKTQELHVPEQLLSGVRCRQQLLLRQLPQLPGVLRKLLRRRRLKQSGMVTYANQAQIMKKLRNF